MIFEDRTDAGKQLARKLLQYREQQVIVVALPRGGVPVGYEIAQALGASLAVLPVRKIGAPFNPEYAIGAIAPDGIMQLEESIVKTLNISNETIKKIIVEEQKELDRRITLYGSPPLLKKRTVILVDDGLATGLTAKAAITAIKKQKPRKIILAVPCAPIEIIEDLANFVDSLICLEKKNNFSSVGSFYRNFDQVTDEEVLKYLEKMKIFISSGFPRPRE